jgi:gliding motility-associated-like protein
VIPTVTLSAFSDVCTTTPAFTLTGGAPTTGGVGVYSGTGVNGGSFNPATAGAGSYPIKYVFTTELGCKDSATQNITVSLAATLSISPVTALCSDAAPVTLVANVQGGVFTGPGVSGGSFNPAAAGVGSHVIGYSLPGNTCSVPASLTITVNPAPVGFSAGADVDGIFGRTSTISGSGPADYSYLWSPATFLNSASSLVTTSTVTETTNYTLTATNSFGCTATDQMTLTVSKLCIDPPNVFTPNGDGFYDRWVVINGTCTKLVKVSVFNRWGGMVYENDRYGNEWDGTYKGKQLPDGTYYYIVEARLNNGESMLFRGNVTIMR